MIREGEGERKNVTIIYGTRKKKTASSSYRDWGGGGGAYSFVDCLGHLTIDHARLIDTKYRSYS